MGAVEGHCGGAVEDPCEGADGGTADGPGYCGVGEGAGDCAAMPFGIFTTFPLGPFAADIFLSSSSRVLKTFAQVARSFAEMAPWAWTIYPSRWLVSRPAPLRPIMVCWKFASMAGAFSAVCQSILT